MSTYIELKNMKELLSMAMLSLGVFFTPVHGLAIGIGVAIFIDTILGVWKNVKLNGWKIFTSRKLSALATKALLYLGVVYLVFPIDYFIMNEFTLKLMDIQYLSTKAAALTLIFIELKSIRENIEEIFKINIWKLLKELLSRAKEIKEDINDITQ